MNSCPLLQPFSRSAEGASRPVVVGHAAVYRDCRQFVMDWPYCSAALLRPGSSRLCGLPSALRSSKPLTRPFGCTHDGRVFAAGFRMNPRRRHTTRRAVLLCNRNGHRASLGNAPSGCVRTIDIDEPMRPGGEIRRAGVESPCVRRRNSARDSTSMLIRKLTSRELLAVFGIGWLGIVSKALSKSR